MIWKWWEELLRMWSINEGVEHVIGVGSFIIPVKENVSQNSLYLFAMAEIEFLSSYDWFSLRITFQF